MRSEYKRDMNHNYLVLYGEDEIDTSAYQVRMLVGNIIPSLLKCRIQGMDGKFVIYYDITSRQSLVNFYEDRRLKKEDLKLIFGEFIRVMEDAAEYLINPGQLVLMPEYMFLEVEKKEIYFCLMPGYQNDVRRQFQALTEYILPKIDHEDDAAVMIGYGVYRRALEDSFHLEHIKEELYRERDCEKAVKERSLFTDSVDEPYGKRELSQNADFSRERDFSRETDYGRERDFSRERDSGREADSGGKSLYRRKNSSGRNVSSLWKKILGFGCSILVMAALLMAKMSGYLPGIGVDMILGIVLAGMGAGMLIYIVFKKKKTRTASENNVMTPQKFHGNDEAEEAKVHGNGGAAESDFYRSGELSEKEEWNPVGKARGESKSFTEMVKSKEEGPSNCGETVVLSLNSAAGPPSLVSREPGELATIYLEEELTVIGKLHTAADAVIDLPTVSRVHAKIRKRDGEYYLTDLNSRNGTSVNGRLLKADEEYCLQNEDEVDFAQARYVFLNLS